MIDEDTWDGSAWRAPSETHKAGFLARSNEWKEVERTKKMRDFTSQNEKRFVTRPRRLSIQSFFAGTFTWKEVLRIADDAVDTRQEHYTGEWRVASLRRLETVIFYVTELWPIEHASPACPMCPRGSAVYALEWARLMQQHTHTPNTHWIHTQSTRLIVSECLHATEIIKKEQKILCIFFSVLVQFLNYVS